MQEQEKVEFNEEQNNVPSGYVGSSGQVPILIRWILKTKIASNQKQATYMLLGIAVLALIATFLIFFSGLSGADVPQEALIDPLRGYTPSDT